jgi:hypothetical protein
VKEARWKKQYCIFRLCKLPSKKGTNVFPESRLMAAWEWTQWLSPGHVRSGGRWSCLCKSKFIKIIELDAYDGWALRSTIIFQGLEMRLEQ